MFFRIEIPIFLMLIFGLPLVFGGFIDPRYPDYIVDPLVPCEGDGYFVHPRNCSWFYRCHSNENITGFYRRDYFECAPGTAFSEDSSVCEVGSWKSCIKPAPNCDSCGIANVNVEGGSCDFFDLCPDQENKDIKSRLHLCHNPKYGCEKCSHLSACKKGEWLLVDTEVRRSPSFRNRFPIQCHPSPYSPEVQCPVTITTPPPNPCGECRNILFHCEVYDVCPDGVNSITVTLCSHAERVCATCPLQKLCPVGQYFENKEQSCYPSPDSPPMQCPPPLPLPPPTADCSNCSIQTSFCNPIEVCINGANPVTRTFCALAVKECTTCDLKETVCPEAGSFFVEEDQKCHPLPVPSDWQCPTVEPTTTNEPFEGSLFTVILTEPTPSNCGDCGISTSDCINNSELCPDGVKRKNFVLCSVATKVCPSCPDQNVCADGERYNQRENKCYSDVSLSCDPPTTTLSSVEPTKPPCTDCYIETVRCESRTVCPFGEPATTMRFCQRATRVCETCGSIEQICSQGEFYSMERTSCFPNPSSDEMQCKKAHPVAVRDSSVNKQALAPKITPVVQCSSENLLPQDQWIKEKFCKNYQSCFRGVGKPTGIIELCTGYFECIYDVIDRDWNLVRSRCHEKQLFSYEANSCVSEPVDICRVF